MEGRLKQKVVFLSLDRLGGVDLFVLFLNEEHSVAVDGETEKKEEGKRE